MTIINFLTKAKKLWRRINAGCGRRHSWMKPYPIYEEFEPGKLIVGDIWKQCRRCNAMHGSYPGDRNWS